MNRRLTLRRETLAALTTDDLAAVNGAAEQELPTYDCFTGAYPTLRTPCNSVWYCITIAKTSLCPTTA